MKGLLLKDFYVLKRQGKILLPLMLFYLFYTFATKSTAMLGTMLILLSILMTITTLAYDEKANWDKYALSMPVSRKAVVISKYLFSLIMILISLLVIVPVAVLLTLLTPDIVLNEALTVLLSITAVATVIFAIQLPIMFKFGVEKGRLLMMIVFLAPTFLAMYLPKSGLPAPSAELLKTLAYTSPLIIVILLLISVKISLKIYQSKEF